MFSDMRRKETFRERLPIDERLSAKNLSCIPAKRKIIVSSTEWMTEAAKVPCVFFFAVCTCTKDAGFFHLHLRTYFISVPLTPTNPISKVPTF